MNANSQMALSLEFTGISLEDIHLLTLTVEIAALAALICLMGLKLTHNRSRATYY